MKKWTLFIIMVLPLICFSQTNLKELRKKSWQTFVYRISAIDAEQFLKWDSIPISRFENIAPVAIIYNESEEEVLPIGHYVLINIVDYVINARCINRSDLIALGINNKHELQIDLRKKNGEAVNDAKVFVNNKEAKFNKGSRTFWIKQKNNDKVFVKVYTTTDTLFTEFSSKEDLRVPIAKQMRNNYKRTLFYRIINWPQRQIKNIFNPDKRRRRYTYANGYIIFDQPKYKPLDTVRYKAYVVDKRSKQYKKRVEVHLQYNSKNTSYDQVVARLDPSTPGAYIGQFVLADSMPSDARYNFSFTTKSKKRIVNNWFMVEDYVLDEIGTYSFKNEKETYFRNDTLRLSAEAKDGNGLNVMDAKATLLLTVSRINKFYADTLFVADTIFQEEKKLLTDTKTTFHIPASILPKADIAIVAKLIFKNSNNELHEEKESFDYKYASKEVLVTQEEDSIKAVYLENGLSVNKEGIMRINDDTAVPIRYPFVIKIDPVADKYVFFTDADKKNSLATAKSIENNYNVPLTRISKADTLGFLLSNPYKIPVYFTVMDGKRIIATGKTAEEKIKWEKIMTDHRRSYKVRWQYIWGGRERQQDDVIGLLYKLLKIDINTSPNVFPGQKDSLKISVTDYKGKPAANVNLTAISYNNQFKKDIRVPEPPYLAKYKGRRFIEREGFEEDGYKGFKKEYILGWNKAWVNKFGLDSMGYYKFLFPKDHYYDAVTLTGEYLPQISVNIVKKGVPQEIYLLYIDRRLVYYNGVTDKMNYAFRVYPGYVKIEVRLQNKYIEIDSFYVQANYKHDISFNLDHLPSGSKITEASPYWSQQEMNLLENSIWQMENNYQNNNAYIWQGSSVVKLNKYQPHTAGPFAISTLNFFNPGYFDIAFNFEPGYQYSLSKQIVRLEKKALFPIRTVKNLLPVYNSSLLIGDTVMAAPQIFYPAKNVTPFLLLSANFYSYYFGLNDVNNGSLQFVPNKDSALKYIILQGEADAQRIVLSNNGYRKVNNLTPGKYSLLLVTNNFSTATFENIIIKGGGTECVDMASVTFIKDHPLINRLIMESKKAMEPKNDVVTEYKEPEKVYVIPDEQLYTIANGATVMGTIKDKVGRNAIPFASVTIKDARTGIISDAYGQYSLSKLRAGKYILRITAAGYAVTEVVIELVSNAVLRTDVFLVKGINSDLSEVVVTSAFNTKRTVRNITSSVQMINGASLTEVREININNALAGKVAGMQVRSYDSTALGRATIVRLRGENGMGVTSGTIYVVDGIVYKTLPANINPDNIKDVTVLQSAAAMALFGADGINGAVIITTDVKTMREKFKDHALWQPNFFTDKNGLASTAINYPDNITGWKTYVIAMDKKLRVGKGYTFTQAYKPLLAQLSVPQFLVEGDSAVIVGKRINYTADKYSVSTYFTINGVKQKMNQSLLQPNDASIEYYTITNHGTDTLTTAFTIESTTGFKDGEERKIPAVKKGIEETVGNFWLLQKDTTVSFQVAENASAIDLYAQNNTLDVLMDELENLHRYPYYCMEQTASKLMGFGMEKKIREQLKQTFKNEKELKRLLLKIQKAQLFEGGWAWWDNGKANFYISNYVINALLQFRNDPLLETNIRNGFIYLQNQLPFMQRNELLAALVTLSEGRHDLNYAEWINKIPFDSLSQHAQWQWVKIKQQQQMNYKEQLRKLVMQKIPGMLGSTHWGVENYSWYSNDMATTVLAFNVLKHENEYKDLLSTTVQYFLEKRNNARWRNTVESANILNAILPFILAQQKDLIQPAVLHISGDTNFVINAFPYKLTLDSKRFKNIHITRSGGGLVYFTAYQKIFNTMPTPVENNFVIKTLFKKNNQHVDVISAGEKVKMIITVNVLKEADYVMLQIPIPAGCVYANKGNSDWRVYKEFYKDKLMLFTESLSKGIHEYEIELEPRYTGNYTLNPVKAELMYFPTFYGRNEMKKVQIK